MEDTPLIVTADIVPEGTIISVAGQLDINTAPQLSSILTDILCKPDKRVVILDMREVGMMDSVGIAMLLRSQRLLHYSERRFHILLKAASQPDRILKLGGFSGILHFIYDIRELKTTSSSPAHTT